MTSKRPPDKKTKEKDLIELSSMARHENSEEGKLYRPIASRS